MVADSKPQAHVLEGKVSRVEANRISDLMAVVPNLTLQECKLCGCRQSRLIQTGARHAPAAQVRRCVACGLVFLHPMPCMEDLASYYATSYRIDCGELPIGERFQRDLPEAYNRVQRLLPRVPPGARLLEVGSGSGAFLYAVAPLVGEVVGVEPEVASRNWITGELGFKVEDTLTQAQDQAFHLVASFHVLEHVPDPVEFLTHMRQALLPGGELIIEVPNVDDALVGVYQMPAYLNFYYQKAHLYYFSQQTLALALEKAGYEADIGGIQRYDLSNHLRWLLTGQPGGQGYYSRFLGPEVREAYAEALIRAGHSDTLWAVARLRTN